MRPLTFWNGCVNWAPAPEPRQSARKCVLASSRMRRENSLDVSTHKPVVKSPQSELFMNVTHRRVLISVHGIRTFGQWQERLARLLKERDPDALTISYHYGFFSVLAFLFPPLRFIEVQRFRKRLLRILASEASSEVSLVGHSFGTHLIGWALAKGIPPGVPPVRRILLAGSVLRSTFDWHDLIERGIVSSVVNDCGIDDNVLLLSQFFVLFTGMAGRLGFSGPTGNELINRFFRGGHSHYFLDSRGKPSDEFMAVHWLPILANARQPSHQDERINTSALGGAHIWFIQNADVVKIGSIIGISLMAWQFFYVTPRALAAGADILRHKAIAESQLAFESQIPNAVATLARISATVPEANDTRELVAFWLPQLLDFDKELSNRGLPAFFSWRGRNLLLTGSQTHVIGEPEVVQYAFSRDKKELLLFDVKSEIRRVKVATGEVFQVITPDAVASEHSARAPDMSEKFRRMTSRLDELNHVTFFETPDSRYFIGIGQSSSSSAGGASPAVVAIERSGGWVASYSDFGSGFAFQEQGPQLKIWIDSPPYELAGSNVVGCNQSNPVCMQLILPIDANGFGLQHDRKTPKAIASALGGPRDRYAGIPPPSWEIGSVNSNQVASRDSSDNHAQLLFPSVFAASQLWSGIKKSISPSLDSFISDDDFAELHVGLKGQGLSEFELDEWASTRNRISVFRSQTRVVVSTSWSSGPQFAEHAFCSGPNLRELEACTTIRTHGNDDSFEISSDAKYLAVSDTMYLGHPSFHLVDLSRMESLAVDKLPPGSAQRFAFTGNHLLVATSAGVYMYEISATGATRMTIYRGMSEDILGRGSSRTSVDFALLPDQLVTASSLGLVQSYDIRTGNVEWVANMDIMGSARVVAIPELSFFVVYDDRCAHFLHRRSGARVTLPVCVDALPPNDSVLMYVEVSSEGRVQIHGETYVYSRSINSDPSMYSFLQPSSHPFAYRLRSFFGITQPSRPSSSHVQSLTGYDSTQLPPKRSEELPKAQVSQ